MGKSPQSVLLGHASPAARLAGLLSTLNTDIERRREGGGEGTARRQCLSFKEGQGTLGRGEEGKPAHRLPRVLRPVSRRQCWLWSTLRPLSSPPLPPRATPWLPFLLIALRPINRRRKPTSCNFLTSASLLSVPFRPFPLAQGWRLERGGGGRLAGIATKRVFFPPANKDAGGGGEKSAMVIWSH